MNNELLLLSNNDIPFPEAQITIHNPSLKEISLIGEENFFTACQTLFISKEKFDSQDKIALEDMSNFEIFMSIINSAENNKYKNCVLMLFTLLFPECRFKITQNEIILIESNSTTRINDENFELLKDILNSIFDLTDSEISSKDYNPSSKRAEKIAEKFRKRKEKIANLKEETTKVAVFSRYVSILAVALQKDMNSLMEYTVFQLKDEFLRYQKKQSFDIYLQAKMAGAQDLDEVDNWMDNIHS